MIKAVFIDIDETLTNSNREITQNTKKRAHLLLLSFIISYFCYSINRIKLNKIK